MHMHTSPNRVNFIKKDKPEFQARLTQQSILNGVRYGRQSQESNDNN